MALKKIKVQLISPLIEVFEMDIDRKRFEKLRKKKVIDRYELFELRFGLENYLVSRFPKPDYAKLVVDGMEIKDFSEQCKKLYEIELNRLKHKTKDFRAQWMRPCKDGLNYKIVLENHYKSAVYGVNLSNGFDMDRFSLKISKTSIFNDKIFEGLVPYYSNKKMKWDVDNMDSRFNLYILSSSRKKHPIKIDYTKL